MAGLRPKFANAQSEQDLKNTSITAKRKKKTETNKEGREEACSGGAPAKIMSRSQRVANRGW